MGQPEREPLEPFDNSATPEPSPKIEILSDLEGYQARIESQWESAKNTYQDKINKILDEFIDQNIKNPDNPAPAAAPSAPNTEIPETPNSPPPQQNPEARIEQLLRRAEKVIEIANKKSRFSTPLPSMAPLQLSWDNHSSWLSKILATKRFWLPALGVAVAAGLWIWMQAGVQTVSLPYARAAGLVVENDKIFIVDWFRKTLFIHGDRRGFPIEAVENIPNQFATGFAKSADKMWTLDGLAMEIMEHSITPDHSVKAKFPAPGKKPAGLFFDGADLWSMDDGTKLAYRHMSNDVEEIKAAYKLPAMNVTALAVIKNRVWVLSEKSRVLKEFRLEDPLREMNSYDLDAYLDGSTVTGFSIKDGKYLYLAAENPAKLIRVPMSALRSQLINPNH